ncbi:MAG: hypothetical protein ISP90_05160 [Nevskia sp.]|nr:hypothetical protein [Nevskia sp.]
MREDINADVIEICDLEYDVAGVGAAEAANSQEHQAIYLISYRLPETAV